MFAKALVFLALTHCIQGECPEGCPDNKLALLYEDIDCKPIYDKPTDCCPIKYDCSHIEKTPSGICRYKGKEYNDGEDLPKELTYANCRVGCKCIQGEIRCAILDCPEWLGAPTPPGCYRTYKLGECCSVGSLCPAKDEIAKCEVGNNTYSEGERFDAPDQKCVECVCQKGFDGKFEEPFCRKRGCSAEIGHTEDIVKHCAAVYSGKESCCPFEWICPNDKEDKFVSSTKGKENSELQCKYGQKLLNVGEQFERSRIISDFEKTETKCECVRPPFVSCSLARIYDLDKAPEHIRPHLPQTNN